MPVLDAEGRVEIEGRVLVNTGKAILFLRDDDEKGVWLPLSKITLLDSNRDDRAVVTLPPWLAKEKGFV